MSFFGRFRGADARTSQAVPSRDSGHDSVVFAPDAIRAVAAGKDHRRAVRRDGQVMAWGSNQAGQLHVPPGLAKVVAVSAGAFHSLALRADGTVVAWGSDENGQSTVPADLRGVVAVAAGQWHSIALRSDGTVVAWGRAQSGNDEGQSDVPHRLGVLLRSRLVPRTTLRC